MAEGTAFLVGSIISAAAAVGAAAVGKRTQKEATAKAEIRSRKEIEAAQALASKATAPVTKIGGNIELQSIEAEEDEAIRSRSARSRLRIQRQSGSSGSVGTGLKVG